MTPRRAGEIFQQARAHGPCWVDHLTKFCTAEELEEVRRRWDTMAGTTCWWDAFNSFRLAGSCTGTMQNGPDKRFTRCSSCQGISFEANEGDRCTR